MDFIARNYQETTVEKVRAAWRGGHCGVLVHAATGAGKTVMAGMVMDRETDWFEENYGRKPRIMFNVHNIELVDQPLAKLKSFFPHLHRDAGVVQGSRKYYGSRIIAATFQSLYSKDFAPIEHILSAGAIDYLIEDECHRSLSKKRIEIIRKLKEANPNMKIMGLSATPFRQDGKGMGKVFDYMVQPPLTMKYLTGKGYLAPFPQSQVFRFDLPEVDFAKLRSSRLAAASGEMEFTASSIESLLDVDNVHEIMFEKWMEYGFGFKTIAFCATVKHAHDLGKYFSERGVSVGVVAGNKKDTGVYESGGGFARFSRIKRVLVLERYEMERVSEEDRSLDIVFNCGVLTEGFDAPITQCILLARPIRSPALFVQILGRGARLFPSSARHISESKKKWCRVLLFCGVNSEAMLMPADMNGRRPKEKAAIKKAVDNGLMIDFVVGDHGLGLDCPPDSVLVKQVDLLCKSKYAWFMDDRVSSAGIGRFSDSGVTVYHGIAVTRPGNGVSEQVISRLRTAESMWDDLSDRHKMSAEMMRQFLAGKIAVWYYQWTPSLERRPMIIGVFDDIKDAVEMAENYAESLSIQFHGSSGFVSKNSRWRDGEIAEPSRIRLENRYGVDLAGKSADSGSRSLYYKFAKEVFGG